MELSQEDTIVAIGTPMAESAVGMIRVSGPKTSQIAAEILNFSGSYESHRMSFGRIINGSEALDEVMFCFMKSPKSYTGEDLLEIYCHGSPLILIKIQELVLSKGAALASAGEFTQRAFLNGKMDLSQAEAVIDLIQAKTDLQRRCALYQLQGEFSKSVLAIRGMLFDVMVEAEANIDFPEYVPKGVTQDRLHDVLGHALLKTRELFSSVQNERILKNGFQVVLMGEPNVGKSSLLNALAEREVAIVTELPGTTRDAIHHSMSVNGIPVHLTDTAGIRSPENIIEQKGIEISDKKYQEADLVLWILDYAKVPDLESAKKYLSKKKPSFIVINKIDLEENVQIKDLEMKFSSIPIFKTSALTDLGIRQLRIEIERWVTSHTDIFETQVLLNERHRKILTDSENSILSALEALQKGLGDDLVAGDLRYAIQKLDEILGREMNEEILDSIFSRFCIGK